MSSHANDNSPHAAPGAHKSSSEAPTNATAVPAPELVRWLYIDFNSYFASVEQHLDPRLRGRPIAVVPMLSDTTCVIAASYEAKAFGIKTGTMVGDAKRLCPKLICIAGDHNQYVHYHKKLIDAIESCHPVTAVASIDEVACRLGGRDQQLLLARALAHEIKAKIASTVGASFRCSIGLAPNRFLAKVATDMQKPDGLTAILPHEIPHKLYPLKLRDMIGIGARMEARLNLRGIYTMKKLYALTVPQMREIWGGIGGERFYQWIRGEDLELSFRDNQSIGHQHVLPPAMRTMSDAHLVLQRLLNKAAVRLRRIGMWTRHMHIQIRYTDRARPSWHNDCRMLECQDTLTLQETFEQLWRSARPGTPLKVSLTLSDFLHDSERSFSFFENPKRVKLSHTIDALNERFGKHTVHFGSIHEALDAAPTRIAFSSIPDFES